MNAMSPWALSAAVELTATDPVLFEKAIKNFQFKVIVTRDSVWVQVEMPGGGTAAFRTAYSPGGLEVHQTKANDLNGLDLEIFSSIGSQLLRISLDAEEHNPVLRYTCTLKPDKDLLPPYWPKDIVFTGKKGNHENTAGQIHASQFGTRTGFIYMSQTRPKSASLLYLQNLTAITPYCDQTETSLSGTVGGEWPELGFSLPAAKKTT